MAGGFHVHRAWRMRRRVATVELGRPGRSLDGRRCHASRAYLRPRDRPVRIAALCNDACCLRAAYPLFVRVACHRTMRTFGRRGCGVRKAARRRSAQHARAARAPRCTPAASKKPSPHRRLRAAPAQCGAPRLVYHARPAACDLKAALGHLAAMSYPGKCMLWCRRPPDSRRRDAIRMPCIYRRMDRRRLTCSAAKKVIVKRCSARRGEWRLRLRLLSTCSAATRSSGAGGPRRRAAARRMRAAGRKIVARRYTGRVSRLCGHRAPRKRTASHAVYRSSCIVLGDAHDSSESGMNAKDARSERVCSWTAELKRLVRVTCSIAPAASRRPHRMQKP